MRERRESKCRSVSSKITRVSGFDAWRGFRHGSSSAEPAVWPSGVGSRRFSGGKGVIFAQIVLPIPPAASGLHTAKNPQALSLPRLALYSAPHRLLAEGWALRAFGWMPPDTDGLQEGWAVRAFGWMLPGTDGLRKGWALRAFGWMPPDTDGLQRDGRCARLGGCRLTQTAYRRMGALRV
jgi:hypothetical protein